MRSAVSWLLGMALVPVIWAVPLYCAVRIAPCPAGQMQTRLGIEEVRLSRRETVD